MAQRLRLRDRAFGVVVVIVPEEWSSILIPEGAIATVAAVKASLPAQIAGAIDIANGVIRSDEFAHMADGDALYIGQRLAEEGLSDLASEVDYAMSATAVEWRRGG